MKVEEYKMREEEVPEVWRIRDMTDDELLNTDQIIQNWLREIEGMRGEKDSKLEGIPMFQYWNIGERRLSE